MERCTCARPHWSFEELLPKADLLAFLIKGHEHVTGVAITGSLARLEPAIHDIDLIVFHDGALPVGGCRGNGPPEELQLGVVVGSEIARYLAQVSDGVPVTYFFMKESTLWNCAELQALEKKERHPGFYRTVFCQIPLLLLTWKTHHGGISQFIEGLQPQRLIQDDKPGKLSYESISIRHRCSDPRCRPTQEWEELQREIRKRKEMRAQRQPQPSALDDDS